jgi:hypothetical protein
MARIKKAQNGDSTRWKQKTLPGLTLQGLQFEKNRLSKMAGPSNTIISQKVRMIDREIQRRKGPNTTPKERNGGKTPAWQRKEGKNPEGGLNAKGVASYRAANPGSKLKTAVTTKPSKLKKGSKAANRRKSFCSRMSGMKKKLTSAKTANDPNSRINKSLRKWNC